MDEPSSVSVKELDASKLVHIPGFTLEALQAETHLVQIWEAYQISLERKVLIVNLLQELVSSPEKAAWFEELVRFVARLRHPYFVQVIDVSPSGTEIPYVILEAAEGVDLAGRLREGPLPPEAAARVTRQIAEALDAAWKHSGYIHRNLKAGSIRLQPDGSARIFRFLAGTFCRPGVNPFSHDEDMLIGTPNYMSPEQIDGEPSIDFHTDIYGLGCLFYEMLTGKAPFSEESDPIRVLALQKTGKLPSPTVVNPSIPAGYSYILHRMTAKQAADRYPYWQDVIEDIRRVESGRPPYQPEGAAFLSMNCTVEAPPPGLLAEKTPVAEKKKSGRAFTVKHGSSGTPIVPPRPLTSIPQPADPSVPPEAPASPLLNVAKGAIVLLLVAGAFFLARVRLAGLMDDAAAPVAPEETAEEIAAAADPESGVGTFVPLTGAGTRYTADADEASEPSHVAEVPPQAPQPPAQPSAATAPTPPPPAAEPISEAERMRQEIYPKIAGALRGRTLTEARKLARDLFYEAAKSHPENAATIQHAFVPFRDAVPWEDLVGISLTATSAEQEIVVDGKTHLIRPVSYMSPKLGCQRKENGQWVARTLMLNAMEPDEMWTILRSKPESTLSRKELYSRALLMFRVAPGDEFKSFVRRHKINELRPLFEYVN